MGAHFCASFPNSRKNSWTFINRNVVWTRKSMLNMALSKERVQIPDWHVLMEDCFEGGHLSPGNLEKSPLKKKRLKILETGVRKPQYRNGILVGYPQARTIQPAQDGGFLSHGANPQIINFCLGFSIVNHRAIGATPHDYGNPMSSIYHLGVTMNHYWPLLNIY